MPGRSGTRIGSSRRSPCRGSSGPGRASRRRRLRARAGARARGAALARSGPLGRALGSGFARLAASGLSLAARAALAARAFLARLGSAGRAGRPPCAAAHLGDLRAGQLLDIVDRLGVGAGHQGDRDAGLAGAAGAADAVDIIVRMPGHVVVEDVADALDVEAAGGDVGGDEDVDLVILEAVQLAGSGRTGPCRPGSGRR